MLYEDARPPDRVTQLPDFVLRNSVMFWLVRPNLHSNRTTETEAPERFRGFSTIVREEDTPPAP